jgi:hypothetical protein
MQGSVRKLERLALRQSEGYCTELDCFLSFFLLDALGKIIKRESYLV